MMYLFHIFSIYETSDRLFVSHFLYSIFEKYLETFISIEDSYIQLIEECNSHYDTLSDNEMNVEDLFIFYFFSVYKRRMYWLRERIFHSVFDTLRIWYVLNMIFGVLWTEVCLGMYLRQCATLIFCHCNPKPSAKNSHGTVYLVIHWDIEYALKSCPSALISHRA